MANYETLKAAIQAVIYENGNQEITGSVMQATLLAMVNSLGANYQYAGIATPSTDPGTPDQNVFYLASTAGTYVNFGNIVLAENEVAILKYNGSWTKDVSGLASAEKLNQLDADVNGKVIFDDISHTYSGAGNWIMNTLLLSPGDYFFIKLQTDVPIDLTFLTPSGYVTVLTITDSEWHKVQVPANTNVTVYGVAVYLTYRGSETKTIVCSAVTDTEMGNIQIKLGEMEEMLNKSLDEKSDMLGEGVGGNTFNNNVIYTPNKTAAFNGVVSEIFVAANANTVMTIYVGTVDQNLLFIPRLSADFQVISGNNIIDLSKKNIYILKGESIGFKMATGGIKFNNATAGNPASENSFLYSVNTTDKLFQLQVYGAQKIFKVAFYAKIQSSTIVELGVVNEETRKDINSLSDNVSFIMASQNIVSDGTGKKYKMYVLNGNLAVRSLEYAHVLVVGNSFTVHPTTADSGAAFATSVWWGHWAMAASANSVAWTKLLQNALQANDANAKVTPVFGRPYETGLAALSDNDAFVYWENGTRKSLKANIASFSDVDCVVFFLGDNYTGDAWATKFEAMYNQFATWFPSATLICMSTVTKQNINNDIRAVADQKGATYLDVYGIKTLPYRSRIGAYVMGDDQTLHQINNSSVAGHFGDNGQFLLLSIVAPALGVTPVDNTHRVTLQSLALDLSQFDYLENSIVSVFANANVTSIVVTDVNANPISATLHEDATFGKIFTFTMPNKDVLVSAVTS